MISKVVNFILVFFQIMDGTEITAWRTAAASVVATKHVHRDEKKILAILGAGVQGRSHAIAFRHYFNFSEVRQFKLASLFKNSVIFNFNQEISPEIPEIVCFTLWKF